MPFVARCVRCNWITLATSRDILNICIEEHDAHSHRDLATLQDKDYVFWSISVITHRDYCTLQRMFKMSAFWQAFRRSPKALRFP